MVPLIYYENKSIFARPSTCHITNSTGALRIVIRDTKLSGSIITLSTQNQYLIFLINSSFQVINRFFVLSFENENGRTSHSQSYLPKLEIKGYYVQIDSRNVFDQSINNDIKTYENIRKTATGR